MNFLKKSYEGVQFNGICVTRGGWVSIFKEKNASKGGDGWESVRIRVMNTVQRDQCTFTSRLSDPTLVLRGHSSVSQRFFLGHVIPTHPPRSANNVGPYNFVTLFSTKIWH